VKSFIQRMAFGLAAWMCASTILIAAPLKLVIHDDTGAEGEPLPTQARYNLLKQAIERAISRPVDILVTRDRERVADMMERNQGDLFITYGSDLAAKAVLALGYSFVATARPDIHVAFIGKSAPLENLKELQGKAVAMPRAESLAGQMCLAELRDFLGNKFVARHSREYSAVVWAVENNVESVGCIASHAKAKESLAAKKLKVIYEGRPVPGLPVVASLGLPAADRAAIAKVLSNLDEEGAGAAVLKLFGVTGFTEGGEARLRALSSWLKPK
jgi:ABC-type phosphate/phosphonate transport system substrate-binding protein